MHAYVDETGNTGANIFDAAQPIFYTAALITKCNFDVAYRATWKKICDKHGIDELHASVLGFGGIEPMSRDVLSLFKKVDARFFFSRVEKSYLLTTKVFDTFFDSGENPAVPATAYNIRPLRVILTFKVAMLIDEDLAHRFWDMLMARRESDARALIPGICQTFLDRIEAIPDARSRQIIGDAFSWSKEHPEALDIFISGRQAKNGHMPNVVAFTNLLEGLENFSQRWDRPLKQIVHDRQSQFERTLAEWHKLLSNASDEPVQLVGETLVVQKVAGSTFDVSAAQHSPGIQIADLVLWLFRQYYAKKEIPPNSARILQYVSKRAWISDFSFKGVDAQMTEKFGPALEGDISDLSSEQIARGREIQEAIEQRRQYQVEQYEVDGLMPYQRANTIKQVEE